MAVAIHAACYCFCYSNYRRMIGIIRYGAGNIFSLTAALDRLGIKYGMVNSEADFEQFDRYIIPGVGHAGAAMNKLRQSGMVEKIKTLQKPALGSCLQLIQKRVMLIC